MSHVWRLPLDLAQPESDVGGPHRFLYYSQQARVYLVYIDFILVDYDAISRLSCQNRLDMRRAFTLSARSTRAIASDMIPSPSYVPLAWQIVARRSHRCSVTNAYRIAMPYTSFVRAEMATHCSRLAIYALALKAMRHCHAHGSSRLLNDAGKCTEILAIPLHRAQDPVLGSQKRYAYRGRIAAEPAHALYRAMTSPGIQLNRARWCGLGARCPPVSQGSA